MKDVLLVCATGKTRQEFKESAPLSASIQRLRSTSKKVTSRVTYDNRAGLGVIYNQYLNKRYKSKILVFVHDDVSIQDLFFVEKLNKAIGALDVIGLAGNQDPDLSYPSWFDQRRPLSGFVAHHWPQPSPLPYETIFVSSYGPSPALCAMLDGCFLAVNTERVVNSGIKFDEQFQFHFYDLDFSLSCSRKGLRVGTWPIWAVHQSGGSFGSPEWKRMQKLYRRKLSTDTD